MAAYASELKNGAAATYTYSFEVISTDYVRLALKNSDGVFENIPTDHGTHPWTIDSATSTITMSGTQFPSGTGNVRVSRSTPLTDIPISFNAGSALTAAQLNENFQQTFDSSQEVQATFVNAESPEFDGTLDVNSNNIINAGDLTFEGTDHDTKVTIAEPSADRTITLPNVTGTVITTGDSLTITTGMIANDAIDGTKIEDDAVDSEHIAADSLDAEHYAAGSVDATALGADAVTTVKILDDAVTVDKIADAELKELATMGTATAQALADLTGPEVQTLDGVLATTDEINTALDGITATAANLNSLAGVSATLTSDELEILDGATITTAELNTLDGASATLTGTDLNQLDNNTLTTSATWTSDTQFPSAKNIDDRITARIDPIGGFEAIADEDSFPAADDGVPEGTIISIANVGGMVVPAASGDPAVASCTDASKLGSAHDAADITINNIPATAAGQTLQDGLGMLVIATSTAHTYDFHRVVATDQDVIGLSQQMDDFAARYRVGNTNPTDGLCGLDGTGTGNRPCDGDMFFNTGTGKMLVYDGDSGTANNDSAVQARWEEVQSIGNFKIIPATELADFASGSASVETITDAPTSAEQIILSINGVIQEPQAGSSAPSDGFALDGSIIRLSATPPASSEVWGVIIGSAVNIGTPSNNTVNAAILQTDAVTTVKILNSNVTTAKLADDSVTAAKLADSSSTDADRAVTRNHIRDDAIDGTKLADDAVNSEHYTDGSIDHEHLSTDCIDGDNIADDAVHDEHIAPNINLTGNPTADTQPAGNNTTRIATTEFVTTAVAAVNIVNDTAPQLGGDLDVNGNEITSASNNNVVLNPNGTGIVDIQSTVEVDRASSALVTLTDAETIAVDLSTGANFTVTLGGNRTLGEPTNGRPGQCGSIFVVQDGTGSRTLDFHANWHFAKGGTHPTMSTGANQVDRIDYLVRTTTSVHCVATFNYS